MSHDIKKRKLDEQTDKSPEGDESSHARDVELLRCAFTQSHTPNLIRTLNDSLKTASLEDIQVLKRLVEPLIKASSTVLHCVRCHKGYLESKNYGEACRIQHTEEDHMGKGSNNAPLYQVHCCELEFQDDDLPLSPCYVASHTTDPTEVQYYFSEDEEGFEEDEAAKREEQENNKESVPRNGNVRTCVRQGCVKK